MSNLHITRSSNGSIPKTEELQPYNVFTNLYILQHHTNIARFLIPVDRKRFLSAGDDCTVVIWDIDTGGKLNVLESESKLITCVMVLNELLITCMHKCMKIWNLNTGFCEKDILLTDYSIKCLLQLPDHPNLFCSGSQDLIVWNTQGEEIAHYKREKQDDLHLMVNLNSFIVAASHNTLVVFQLIHCNNSDMPVVLKFSLELEKHKEMIRSLIIIQESLFSSASLDGTINIWSSDYWTKLYIFNDQNGGDYFGIHKDFPYSVQALLCPDQTFLIAAIGCGFSVYEVEGTYSNIIAKPNAHLTKVLNIQLIYSGKILATCSEDGSIRLWGFPQTQLDPAKEYYHDDSLLKLELFLNVRPKSLKTPLEPLLLGECLGHNGAVQMVLDLKDVGFASCGTDGLVVMWKDRFTESEKKAKQVHDILYGIHKGNV